MSSWVGQLCDVRINRGSCASTRGDLVSMWKLTTSAALSPTSARTQPSALQEKLEQDPLHDLQETPAAKLDHANFVERFFVGGDAKGEEAAEGSSVCAA